MVTNEVINKMRKVLIVEDEKRIRDVIADYFKVAKYDVLEAEDGKAALDIFEENEVDLVILDIMMPELDGWSVCKRIRKKSDVPLMFLTSRSDEDDKLMGFEFGADEYVTKPFSPKVLVARANALLDRMDRSKGIVKDEICAGSISVNTAGRLVTLGGERITIAPKEYELLIYMIENQGIVLTREKILEKVWGYDYFGDDRAVDTHIKKLRKALGIYSKYIHTVLRVGYKFEVIV